MNKKSIYWFKKGFVKALFLGSLVSAFAQTNHGHTFDEKVTTNQLREDLHMLKLALEKNHPGLYTYATKTQIDSTFMAIQRSIRSNLNGIEFYRELAVLNSVIKDVHTKVISPESFRKALGQGLPRFPFAVHVDNGRVFVLRNLSNTNEIKPGWEFLSINNEPVEEIISDLLNANSRDGFNKTLPITRLNLYFSGLYGAVKGCPEYFNIEFKDLKGNHVMLKIKGLTHEVLLATSKNKYDKQIVKSSKPIEFQMSSNIGVLKVKSFGGGEIKNAGQSFKKEFQKAFTSIKEHNIEHIIVDLRENRGGWSEVGDELLSYLVPIAFSRSKSDFSLVDRVENKRHYLKNGYIKHFEKSKFKENAFGFDVIWNEKPVKPKKSLFTGTILVLISGTSASETGLFAGILKDKTNAMFIGEETRLVETLVWFAGVILLR